MAENPVSRVLSWIIQYKDALVILFGTGVVGAVVAALYKIVKWLMRVRRERRLRGEDNPFLVLPPGSNVVAAVFPSRDDSPLNDARIPYVERVPGRNVRREMEDLLRRKRALLVCGKSGLGKTREAAHLAQTLNQEGWTVLYLPPEAWLEPPARLPQGVPNRKLLLFFDDLSRKCYSARVEINPHADESLTQPLTRPFQERLLQTIEAFETFCGKDEILVLATTRNERTPLYPGEPAEWDKLEWNRYPKLWSRFACYELPEPDPRVAADLLRSLGKEAHVRVEAPDILARRNDGTLRNLVENLRRAANPVRGLPALTPETFIDTLQGTWADRYRRAVDRYPEAKFLYQAAALLCEYDFPLRRSVILALARELMGPGHWWQKYVRLPRAWRYLERYEGLTAPRDGQLEAAGPVRTDNEALQALIRVGMRYRLAEGLDNLAARLIWPRKEGSAVYHPDAVRILRKVTTWLPEKAGVWYRLGVALTMAQRYEEAIRAYRKAIELDPQYATPWNGLGNVYYALRQYEEALEAYRKAIELDPKYAYPWNNLGIVYSDLGQYKEAIEAYQRAIELDPKYAAPWHGLGNVYRRLGRYEEAMEAYRRAIELDPKYASPWNNLGNVYYALGRYEEAMEAYRKAIALDPKFAYPWNGLGNVYADLGRYEEAMKAYRKAIELDPKYAAPWYNLGIVYRRLGRYEEAMEAYQKAIELDPKDAAPWHGLGLVHTLRGDLDAALDAFRKAVELAPDRGVYHLALFGTLRRLGREEEARREGEIARPLMETESAYNRACFAALRGDKEEALRLLKVALDKAPGYRLWARRDPDLESLHDDPRFRDLVGGAPS